VVATLTGEAAAVVLTAAIGPAPVGESTADERTEFRPGPHRIPYVLSKRQAEAEALTRARRPDLWAARQAPSGPGQKRPKNTTEG